MRRAIAAATREVDERLQSDPKHEGESRDQAQRVLFAFPLGVRFEIDHEQSKVHVLQVWSFKRKS